jgi:hypothetical protein
MPAAVALAAALVFAAASTAASPLRQPTGYKNWCEGMRGVKCARGGVPRSLWRPLSLPAIGPDGGCPADTPEKRFQSTNAVIGRGPAYLNVGNSGNTLRIYDPAPLRFQTAAAGWGVGVLKVALAPTFRGPYVLRGGRIDAPGLIGFSGPAGVRPYSALQIPPRPKPRAGMDVVWSGGYAFLTEPGCYAIQIDGATFSYTIVFRAAFHN